VLAVSRVAAAQELNVFRLVFIGRLFNSIRTLNDSSPGFRSQARLLKSGPCPVGHPIGDSVLYRSLFPWTGRNRLLGDYPPTGLTPRQIRKHMRV
jgi:hypothetical protein